MILSLVFLLMLLCSLGVAWWYERYYQRMLEVLPETARIHAVHETSDGDSTIYKFEICLFEQPGAPIFHLKHGYFRSCWAREELVTVVRLIGDNTYVPRVDLPQLRHGAIVAVLIGGVFGWLASLNWDEMLKNV